MFTGGGIPANFNFLTPLALLISFVAGMATDAVFGRLGAKDALRLASLPQRLGRHDPQCTQRRRGASEHSDQYHHTQTHYQRKDDRCLGGNLARGACHFDK